MIMLIIIIRIRIIYIYMDIHTQSYAYSKPKLFSGGLPEYPNLIWLISSFDSAKKSWPVLQLTMDHWEKQSTSSHCFGTCCLRRVSTKLHFQNHSYHYQHLHCHRFHDHHQQLQHHQQHLHIYTFTFADVQMQACRCG